MKKQRRPEPLAVRIVAGLALGWITLVWVMPVLLVVFHQFPPLVLEQPLWVRLLVSALGSAVALLLMAAVRPRRFREGLRPAAGERPVKRVLLLVGAFALFTWCSATLAANVLGPLSWLLPSRPFERVVVLAEADDSSWRFSHVSLSFVDPVDGRLCHLKLARSSFEPSGYAAGQTLVLRGDESALGRYVTSIARLP